MKKFGFTLTEILITLGIIGVVAAITIPSIIANTNGKKYAAAYKNKLSLISQAARLSLGKSSFDFASATQLCMDKDGNEAYSDGVNFIDNGNPQNSSFCTILATNLDAAGYYYWPDEIWTYKKRKQPYFDFANGSAFQNMGISYPYNIEAFELADGAIVGFRVWTKEPPCELNGKLTENWIKTHRYCFGYIDVNGAELPDKEVKCSNGVKTSINVEDTTCKVDTNKITDIYPVVFHDSLVEPASNAAKYVFTHY